MGPSLPFRVEGRVRAHALNPWVFGRGSRAAPSPQGWCWPAAGDGGRGLPREGMRPCYRTLRAEGVGCAAGRRAAGCVRGRKRAGAPELSSPGGGPGPAPRVPGKGVATWRTPRAVPRGGRQQRRARRHRPPEGGAARDRARAARTRWGPAPRDLRVAVHGGSRHAAPGGPTSVGNPPTPTAGGQDKRTGTRRTSAEGRDDSSRRGREGRSGPRRSAGSYPVGLEGSRKVTRFPKTFRRGPGAICDDGARWRGEDRPELIMALANTMFIRKGRPQPPWWPACRRTNAAPRAVGVHGIRRSTSHASPATGAGWGCGYT